MNRMYYAAKPYLSADIRWQLRRRRACRLIRASRNHWPIDTSAQSPPNWWKGWPNEKKFSVVLTHDVESSIGLNQVKALAELEMKHGFRSSFNFIPEGEYLVSDELRAWLVDRGFEVGVHDLHHDGKLYTSRKRFDEHARKINRYLKQWNAVGFRSGFMLRELEWLHELEIEYDCSTFDTDPFEPQPNGAKTIFPFWIPKHSESMRPGYVEMPYTLPQDSTLFLLLGMTNSDVWTQKAKWLIERNGMILVNVHPDYINFDKSYKNHTFPIRYYEELLRFLSDQGATNFWNPLPMQVSRYVAEQVTAWH